MQRTRRLLLPLLLTLLLLVSLVPAAQGGSTNTHLLITALYFDPYTSGEPDEAVWVTNPTAAAIDISGWQVSNNTNTRAFPSGTSLAAGATLVIAKQAVPFKAQWGYNPNLEYGGNSDAAVPDMVNTTTTAPTFANAGSQVLLKTNTSTLVDALAYGTSTYAAGGWSGATVPTVSEGNLLHRARDPVTMTATNPGDYVTDTDTAADWKQGLDWRTQRSFTQNQSFLPWPAYSYTGNVTVYSSPDSSYATMAALFDSATTSIDVNVYEFNLVQLKDKLQAARSRGVAVRLFLEGGPVGGITDQEKWIAQELYNAGAQVRFIINDSASNIHDRYAFDHAKYGIIDHTKVFVESENLKDSGMPVSNTYGNRGWGIIVENSSYASFMESIFNKDFDTTLPDSKSFTPGDATYGGPPAGFVPSTAVTTGSYVSAFAGRSIAGTFAVTPWVIPDHGLIKEKGLRQMMAGATKSLYVEQLYIHKYWGSGVTGASETTTPDLFLQDVLAAARRGVRVRVILDAAWLDATDPRDNQFTVQYINSIAAAEGLDMQAQLINLTATHLKEVHNKGVIVDGHQTLVSSINWSENSPANNREMGVIIDNADVADFFNGLFQYDWYDGNPTNHLLFSEVQYHPSGTQSANEWLEVYNPTASSVTLTGWTAKDNAGTWSFPAGTTIAAGQALTVARTAAGFNSLYAKNPDVSGLTLSLADGGDYVKLIDAKGIEVDRVAWESYLPDWSITAGVGTSLRRTTPGQETYSRLDWTSNAAATPGTP